MDEAAVCRELTEAFPGVQLLADSGDVYFYAGADRRLPFATLVTGDRHDTVSDLDRPNVFRLNIGVGKETFAALFGPRPTATATATAAATDKHRRAATGHDFAALDTIMPHPVYGAMHWLCVLNPSPATFERLRPLLAEAHRRAAAREQKLRPATTP